MRSTFCFALVVSVWFVLCCSDLCPFVMCYSVLFRYSCSDFSWFALMSVDPTHFILFWCVFMCFGLHWTVLFVLMYLAFICLVFMCHVRFWVCFICFELLSLLWFAMFSFVVYCSELFDVFWFAFVVFAWLVVFLMCVHLFCFDLSCYMCIVLVTFYHDLLSCMLVQLFLYWFWIMLMRFGVFWFVLFVLLWYAIFWFDSNCYVLFWLVLFVSVCLFVFWVCCCSVCSGVFKFVLFGFSLRCSCVIRVVSIWVLFSSFRLFVWACFNLVRILIHLSLGRFIFIRLVRCCLDLLLCVVFCSDLAYLVWFARFRFGRCSFVVICFESIYLFRFVLFVFIWVDLICSDSFHFCLICSCLSYASGLFSWFRFVGICYGFSLRNWCVRFVVICSTCLDMICSEVSRVPFGLLYVELVCFHVFWYELFSLL